MHTVAESVAALGGVASTGELAARGFSLRAIDASVAAGAVRRVRRGWVALPGAPPEVVRSVAARGTLSCVSVLRARDVWTADTPESRLLHVRVPRFDKIAPSAAADGLHIHRSWPTSTPTPARGGVDSIEWALLHATMCQPRLDAIASLESALHLRVIRQPRVLELLDTLPRRYSEFAQVLAPAESGVETHTRLGLRAAGIRCRSQVSVSGVGDVDLVVGDRLVIEVDGRRWHSDKKSFREDKRRDLALVSMGYLVIRLSYEQVMFQWERVLAVIRDLMRRGEHRWAARHRRGALLVP
ncbi:endonuclease domain-containing protein [Herbiconiux sp. CPCC 205763]|uniref:Endonuclease domain-containing protein n=1 Tax=Herbiconiux aconitum TaxID=2970913 RepID=A0ABT2GVX5_9MICO|nr:endonuclease domain-containing protein [Herbiconiux aconitum]MCS5719430.1 endonuclease domain-containing protein [Herbiconiux aconitum]